MEIFLYILVYLIRFNQAEDIFIPLCSAWKPSGTIAAGSPDGVPGNDSRSLNSPTAIFIVEKTDTLYIVDSGNNRIMKYNNGSIIGQQINITTQTSNGTLWNPQDIVIDESGAIYISDSGYNRIVKWSFNPPKIDILLNVNQPRGLYFDTATNSLYIVTSDATPAVMHYDLENSKTKIIAAGGSPQRHPPRYMPLTNALYQPIGIHVNQDKQIFVAEAGGNRITGWLPNSAYAWQVAGTGAAITTLLGFSAPSSVIVDNATYMYISDTHNNRIVRWKIGNPSGDCLLGCTIIISNTTHQLNDPYDIAFDSRLNLLVVERARHRVQRFDFYFSLPCMLQYCKPPIISMKHHPPINIRSQSLTFFINVKLDCYIWVTTDMKCTVIACYPGDRFCIQTTKLNTIINAFIVPKSYDITIPSFGLPLGEFNFSCIINMTATGLNSSINTTVEMIRSSTTVRLLPLGKSQITLGYQQQYTFSPTISPNDSDINNIRFVYYCRKYPNFNYSMINNIRLSIDDDSQQPKESTCFSLTGIPNSFIYDDDKTRSSLTIMSRSLKVNQTYEFYVELYDKKDLIDKSDAVLVHIQSEDSFIIHISSEFNNLILDNDYQLLNPSTQIILRSTCMNSCGNVSIEWKIYQGTMNDNNSIIEWEEYPYLKEYANKWFYGVNSSRLTATNKLFSSNKNISYWQFEVIYTNEDKHGSGLVQLKTNHPPIQGFCTINPIKGHTSDSYTVNCQNWTDLDGVKDYFLHVISSKLDIQMSIAYSIEPIFTVFLPSGDPKSNYNLNLTVHVRDMLGAWTESKVMTIQVIPNTGVVNEILHFTENSHNLIDDLLINGDQNQLMNSFSTILNQMALVDQESLMKNGQEAMSKLVISTFDETLGVQSSIPGHINASLIFIKNLNHRALIREYFLKFYENFTVPTTIEQIIILSSTINQLTSTTSEWTQISLAIASNICNLLANALQDLSREIIFEQITLVVNSIAQCASNAFTGVNVPLQNRGLIFDHDLNKTSSIESKHDEEEIVDYDLLEMGLPPDCNDTRLKDDQICKEIVLNSDNSTREIIYKNRDFYHQKHLANKLQIEIDQTIFLLGKSIRRHLNIFQEFPITYPRLRVLVEPVGGNDIQNKSIDLFTRNASIYLPHNLTLIQSDQYGVQTTLLPLAPDGGIDNVNLSTALTLSILDDNDVEVKINATDDAPIEMFIPRDVNLPIPSFVDQYMSLKIAPQRGTIRTNRQFFIYYINITQTNPNLTISIHFELQPFDFEISYGIVYKFDAVPAYNSTHVFIDGWTMFCYENSSKELDYYKYYIDNTKTAGHKSILLGIRELDKNEICSIDSLPQITDQPFAFSSNYSVRMYSSGCYYLDNDGLWKSDGMKVGPKTNYQLTHCYSNHT